MQHADRDIVLARGKVRHHRRLRGHDGVKDWLRDGHDQLRSDAIGGVHPRHDPVARATRAVRHLRRDPLDATARSQKNGNRGNVRAMRREAQNVEDDGEEAVHKATMRLPGPTLEIQGEGGGTQRPGMEQTVAVGGGLKLH